jgi:diguanylate cyclase (GGDEF)-like protein/PAS domain S-box-containing protein
MPFKIRSTPDLSHWDAPSPGGLTGADSRGHRVIQDYAVQSRDRVAWRIDDAVVLLNPDGRVATWNASAEELYGYTPQEIVGRHYGRFFVSADIERRWPEQLLELASLEKMDERAWRVRRDGSRFWAQTVMTAQRNAQGELVGFVSESHDLTDPVQFDPPARDSDAQLQAFLKNGPSAMFVKDTAGRYLHVNEQFIREFGLSVDAVLGRTNLEIFPPDLAQALSANDTLVLGQGKTLEFKQQRQHGDRCHTNLICKFPIHDDSRRTIGIGGTITDITEQLLAAQSIQKQAARQGLIVAFGQFALQNPEFDELITEAAATIEKGLQPEFCRYLALAPDETQLHFKAGSGWQGEWANQVNFDAVTETEDRFSIGARETILIDDFAHETRYATSPVIKSHGIRSGAEVLVWGANGPYGLLGIYSRATGAFAQESVDFLRGIKNTLAAAIDRKTAEDRLAYLAQFDALTGLPNRNLYLDRLSQTLRHTDRDKRSVGVVFVDVDRFKSVNDKLGHGGGDVVLTQVASRLQHCVRPADTVARLSGDEFALVLDHLGQPADAAMVAERVIASLAKPFQVYGHEIYVSASLGISISPIDGSNPDSLLKNADMAMYGAKQAGRNTYRFFLPEMNERAAELLQTETELRGALERREFILHYQPKADIGTGEISGFEALLRWNHPKRGLVMPNDFIPLLEETGLINHVGEWVVRQACDQIRQWEMEGLRACPIAVNLSARQFNQKNLDFSIGKILEEAQIDPNLLEFELTESVLMSDSEDAVQVLDNMKKYGVRLSVDDFGTGYSSLAYLKRFPLDALKIDRAFISHITTDQGDATIAKAIINLAHSLKLKVVAEGVETQAQLDFLREHHCDEMQGYLFARPMPAADCARALTESWRLPDAKGDKPS